MTPDPDLLAVRDAEAAYHEAEHNLKQYDRLHSANKERRQLVELRDEAKAKVELLKAGYPGTTLAAIVALVGRLDEAFAFVAQEVRKCKPAS